MIHFLIIKNEEELKMKKNDTKKGFTLIELIAVIAILGILAVIIVPNIMNYTKSAKKSNVVSDAKVVVNAIDAYNSDKDVPISDNTTISSISGDTYADLVGANGTIKKWPDSVKDLTVGNVRDIADGNWKVDVDYTISNGVAKPKP